MPKTNKNNKYNAMNNIRRANRKAEAHHSELPLIEIHNNNNDNNTTAGNAAYVGTLNGRILIDHQITKDRNTWTANTYW